MFQHTTLNKEKLGFAAMFVGDMQASTSLFGSIQEMWSMAGIWWLAIIIFFMLVAIPLIESFWLIFIGMQYFNDRRSTFSFFNIDHAKLNSPLSFNRSKFVFVFKFSHCVFVHSS